MKEYTTRKQKKERRTGKIHSFIRCCKICFVALFCIIVLIFCALQVIRHNAASGTNYSSIEIYGETIPEYSGSPYIEVHNNHPFFTDKEITENAYEKYSRLDRLGRCGVAISCVSRELMPTEERESIGSIKPTGWKQAKYEGIVNSEPPYLYNRCHLIAFCLTGENANEQNLITGTRYMNIEGMLPFEEQVARYLDKNDNHVMYRVTPIFIGNELVSRGVLMEAYSVEDQGKDIQFCVFCYNVQPGVTIDYLTGESNIK